MSICVKQWCYVIVLKYYVSTTFSLLVMTKWSWAYDALLPIHSVDFIDS
jgi:hypothetical protein